MRTDEAPYPGLRPFKPSETEIFFGRDECIDTMLSRLAATRFLAVLGSSGIGKSSLVQTGLLPAIQMGMLQGAGTSWLVIDFRPGQPEGSPLRNLVRRLLQKTDQPTTTDNITHLRAQFLQEGPRALLKWCREGHLPVATNMLLLVDQFEELFRYQDYSSREEAEAFVALLLESRQPLEAKSPQLAELPIYVTVTMRSEFLGACSLIQNLPEAITEGAFLTPRMTRDQYREAIIGPAEVRGVKIEAILVNRLLNDLATFAPWDEKEPGQQGSSDQANTTDAEDQLVRLARRADQLPVLQHALNQIWRNAYERRKSEEQKTSGGADQPIELTLDDYKAIGGLENALNSHAEAVLENIRTVLGSAIDHTAERLFRALVIGSTPSDATRRPVPLAELSDIAKDDKGVRAIVDAFRANECNFLMPDPAVALAPTTVIDISHESLIRQWKRLSQWVIREAVAAQQWRRLNDRLVLGEPLRGRMLDNMVAWREETGPNAAWAKRYGGDYVSGINFLKESERAEKNRRLLRNSVVAAAFAFLIILTGAMYYLLQEARAARGSAEAERQHAAGNYDIAKDALKNLTFNFAASVESSGQNPEMQITEVTDVFKNVKVSIDALAKANPNDSDMLGIQAEILDKFVGGYRAAHYQDQALDVANETNAVLRKLIARQPDKAYWQTLLASNLDNIGDFKDDLGDRAGARASYEEALANDRELMMREPGHEDHPRQTAIELIKLGDLQRRDKDSKAALAFYREALALQKKLSALYVVLPTYQRDESVTLGKIGDAQIDLGDNEEALETYQQRLAMDRKIAELDFGVTDDTLQQRLASTEYSIAKLQLNAGDIEAAKKSFTDAAASQRRVADAANLAALKDGHKLPDAIHQYGQAAWLLLLTGEPQEAANYGEPAFQGDQSQTWIDVNLAHAYLFLGRYDDAKAIYLKIKDMVSPGSKSTEADAIRQDFDLFRKLGIAPHGLDRMAKDIGL
jgi:tetratricopeptide (TPR) repeat protein